MDANREIKVPDRTMEFVQKLEDLLREHNFQLMGNDIDAGIMLYSKSGHMLGWWNGEITVKDFNR